MKNTIKAEGTFTWKVIEEATGKVVETFSEKNMVVLIGKTNLTKLIGGDAAGKAVTQVSVGTNGTDPALSDNAITSAFTKNIDSVSYPDASSVEFNFTILGTEANGMTIREAGLILADNTLFARKTRADFAKTSANKLVGTWIIKFI